MQLVVEIDEEELMEQAKKMIAESIAGKMLDTYRNSAERYNYRNVIKECVREAIKSDIDNLSDRAITAASISIANKALKKMDAKDLLALLTGENRRARGNNE